MAKRPIWMPCYITDYLRDTTRLTTEGHGAYLLLIFDYWVQGQPLPDDDEQLAAITRMSLPKWKRLRPTLAQFFQIGDGVWRHKRVDHELALANERIAKLSEAGKRGAAAKHGQATSDDSSQATSKATGEAGGDECAQLTRGVRSTPYKKQYIKIKNTNLNARARSDEAEPLPPKPPPNAPKGKADFCGGDSLARSARSAPNGALKREKRNRLEQKLLRFSKATMPEAEMLIAVSGLCGADPEHSDQWWLDRIDKLMRAKRWDDTALNNPAWRAAA
jgi:uncharacterized protein YdaU (DUF1376 family)